MMKVDPIACFVLALVASTIVVTISTLISGSSALARVGIELRRMRPRTRGPDLKSVAEAGRCDRQCCQRRPDADLGHAPHDRNLECEGGDRDHREHEVERDARAKRIRDIVAKEPEHPGPRADEHGDDDVTGPSRGRQPNSAPPQQRFIIWPILSCTLLPTLMSSSVAVRAAPAASGAVVIADARIYSSPDAAPIEHGVVVIRDGKILAIGRAGAVNVPRDRRRAQVLDVHGATVVAGFWNSHVHLMLPDLLDAETKSPAVLDRMFEAMFTRWGFTSVFDIASGLENTKILRRRIETGEIRGPMILTTGNPFFPEHGTPIYVRDFFAEHHFPSMDVKTPEEAARRAARQLDEGADGVKIFAGAVVDAIDGDRTALPMRLDIATAVVDAAHKRGKPAFAHPSNLAGVNVAIASGVDVLAHTTPAARWTPEVVKRMREHGMALIPTLTLFDVELKKGQAPPGVTAEVLATAVSELKSYSDAGGQILFGTDVGYTHAFDTTEEYKLMGRVLGWREILASLTTSPAQRFGYSSRKGRIAPGMDADIAVLDADPAADVTAFARVRYTIRLGKLIYARNGLEAVGRSTRKFRLSLRPVIRRGTYAKLCSQERLDEMVHQLNPRPRKTLGFETPAECIEACVATANSIDSRKPTSRLRTNVTECHQPPIALNGHTVDTGAGMDATQNNKRP